MTLRFESAQGSGFAVVCDLWYIFLIGTSVGYGIWRQFHGPFSP